MGNRKADAPDFHSERDQIVAMHEAVAKLDGRLEVLPSELDVSGGLPLEQRPSLRAAVEGVEAGRYAGIVVAYQSRLGREVEQEEAVWRRVDRAGGKIVMALDGLDTSTVDGKMVRRIRSAINTGERERHAERFDNLRKWSTENGIWQRRQTPRGYERDGKTRRLVRDHQADDVLRAFRERAAGASISALARRLGMTPGGVRHMLRNRVYLGELRVGEHVNPTAHPPIVDKDTFEAAQRLQPRPPRVRSGPALLAGLVRCASCGHLMTRGGNAKRAVYTCPASHSGEHCPGPAAVTCSVLDSFVEPIALRELERLAVSATEGNGLERAQTALAAAERELTAYLAAVKVADVGADAFAEAARARRVVVDDARAELTAERARRPALPTAGTGAEVWEGLSGHERNDLLRALLGAVIVRRGGGRGSRTPLDERVRVLAFGADVGLPVRRGGEASGIVPIAFPDLDQPGVLGLAGGEDALQGARGVEEMRRSHAQLPDAA